MNSSNSALIIVAQSYLTESCPSADAEQQEKGLKIIESYINGSYETFEHAAKEFSDILNNTVPLEKVQSILAVDDVPLPALDDGSDDNSGSSPSSGGLTHKRKLNPWSQVEDTRLLAGIHKYGLENWLAVAKFVGNSRTRAQCSQRWNRGLDPHLKKCRWTQEEEEKLQDLIRKHGLKAWTQIAQKLGNRSDVQCRYHYNQMMKANTINLTSSPPSSVSSNINQQINHHHQSINQTTTVLPLPTPTITPIETPRSPEITFSHISLSKVDMIDTLNFDNAWDISYTMNDMNNDLFLALEQKPTFLSTDPFLPFSESLF